MISGVGSGKVGGGPVIRIGDQVAAREARVHAQPSQAQRVVVEPDRSRFLNVRVTVDRVVLRLGAVLAVVGGPNVAPVAREPGVRSSIDGGRHLPAVKVRGPGDRPRVVQGARAGGGVVGLDALRAGIRPAIERIGPVHGLVRRIDPCLEVGVTRITEIVDPLDLGRRAALGDDHRAEVSGSGRLTGLQVPPDPGLRASFRQHLCLEFGHPQLDLTRAREDDVKAGQGVNELRDGTACERSLRRSGERLRRSEAGKSHQAGSRSEAAVQELSPSDHGILPPGNPSLGPGRNRRRAIRYLLLLSSPIDACGCW